MLDVSQSTISDYIDIPLAFVLYELCWAVGHVAERAELESDAHRERLA